MLRFHYSLHGGIWGELFVSILSIVFTGSLITGIIVYRKHILRVLAFKVKVRFKNWRVISSDLHRIVGVWALFFNLLIAVTGFWMLRYVYQSASYKKEAVMLHVLPSQTHFSIDSALYNIARSQPSFKAAYLNIPASDSVYEFYGAVNGQWALLANYNSTILMNSRNGNLLSKMFITESSIAEKLDAAVGPLHFDWPVKVLYSIFGLSAPILSITGFLLWWRKKRRADWMKKS